MTEKKSVIVKTYMTLIHMYFKSTALRWVKWLNDCFFELVYRFSHDFQCTICRLPSEQNVCWFVFTLWENICMVLCRLLVGDKNIQTDIPQHWQFVAKQHILRNPQNMMNKDRTLSIRSTHFRVEDSYAIGALKKSKLWGFFRVT